MVFLIYTEEKKSKKREWGNMLNDLICKKREELNKSIEDGQSYDITYKISVELDELIAQYYRETTKKPEKEEEDKKKRKEKQKEKQKKE